MEELTYQNFKKAMRSFRKAFVAKANKGYVYVLPSPNEGKQLVIRGQIGPGEAAAMATEIWKGTAKVSDYPWMKEEEIKLIGKDIKAIYTDTIDFHELPI